MDMENRSGNMLSHIKKPLYKNSLFLIARIIARSGLGFVFWIIVTNFYSEAEVGWGSAIISAMDLLAILAISGFDAALIRFLPEAKKPVKMINNFFTLSAIIAAVISAIFIAGLPWWSPGLKFIQQNIIFSIAFIVFVVCITAFRLSDYTFIARRKAEYVFYKSIIMLLLRLPLPVLLVIFFHSFGIAASWGIAIAITLFISTFIFLPRIENTYKPVPTLKADIGNHVWRYSAGSYITSVFQSSTGLILPLMVLNLAGPQQNAYFYIAWMIASLLFSIPQAVSQSLFAEGSTSGKDLKTHVRRSFIFVFLILVPAVIVIFLAGKWFLVLFGANYSANSLILLRILAISSLLLGINRIYTSILRVNDRIKELVIITGFIAIGTLLGSYLLIPGWGLNGIGYAWLAAQGAVSIYVLFALRAFYRDS